MDECRVENQPIYHAYEKDVLVFAILEKSIGVPDRAEEDEHTFEHRLTQVLDFARSTGYVIPPLKHSTAGYFQVRVILGGQCEGHIR